MDDAEVDALYGLPFAEFVAARDALAKRLRAEKDRDGAAAVKALTKPTRAAWRVNVLVREHRDAVDALAEAAGVLADAQAAALKGTGKEDLPAAAAAARAAADALLDALPADESPAVRDAVAGTLRAAVVDPDVLATVRAARLEREQVAAGFGGLGSALPTPRAGKPPAEGATPEPTRGKDDPGQPTRPAEKANARNVAADERKEQKRLEKQEAAARERAEQQAREREERAAAERAALAAAEAAVEAAQEAVDAAQAELEERRAALREAKQARTAARRAT